MGGAGSPGTPGWLSGGCETAGHQAPGAPPTWVPLPRSARSQRATARTCAVYMAPAWNPAHASNDPPSAPDRAWCITSACPYRPHPAPPRPRPRPRWNMSSQGWTRRGLSMPPGARERTYRVRRKPQVHHQATALEVEAPPERERRESEEQGREPRDEVCAAQRRPPARDLLRPERDRCAVVRLAHDQTGHPITYTSLAAGAARAPCPAAPAARGEGGALFATVCTASVRRTRRTARAGGAARAAECHPIRASTARHSTRGSAPSGGGARTHVANERVCGRAGREGIVRAVVEDDEHAHNEERDEHESECAGLRQRRRREARGRAEQRPRSGRPVWPGHLPARVRVGCLRTRRLSAVARR